MYVIRFFWLYEAIQVRQSKYKANAVKLSLCFQFSVCAVRLKSPLKTLEIIVGYADYISECHQCLVVVNKNDLS